MAAGSIQNGSQIWPSGSVKARLYMKPRSCLGLMSAVPPFAVAMSFKVSTSLMLSTDKASITSLDVEGGIGRSVNLRHEWWLCSADCF